METTHQNILKTAYLFIVILFLGKISLFAHGGENHSKEETKTEVSSNIENHKYGNGEVKAEIADFPTLHPMVVHFPIVLLLIAALMQVASMFIFKKELSWITLFLLAFGFVGAYVAGNYFHPHTYGLSEHTQKVLTQHESYASYTTWLAGIAVLLKTITHFLLKRKWWAEMIVAIIMAASAYTVSTAGHYGAQLIHIEGVGAQGKNLEIEHPEHKH